MIIYLYTMNQQNSHIFMKNGFYCKIEQDENETREHFYERGNFIVSQKPSTESDLNQAIKFSKIWLNILYLGCEYSDEILCKLKKFEKNM
jgi:hypothetical protein